jgi:ABC-2 type transport system permease protein
MNSTQKVTMLIRREIWENRSLWIAPLAIAGLILFAAAFGGIHFSDNDNWWFGKGHPPETVNHLDPGQDKRSAIYGMAMASFTMVQLVVLGVAVFFYLLDSLQSERKDRSILFWKSLPISDTEVVASKALTALVVAPVYVLAVSAVTQLLFGIVWYLRMGHNFPANLLVPFDGGTWLQVQLGFLALVPAVLLWYLPIAAYLLLVSVWARKNAFLWAILPWIALQLVEGLLTQTHYVASFLGQRFGGLFQIMRLDDMRTDSSMMGPPLGEFVSHVSRVFASGEAWLGAIAAAVLFFAVIRIRRYRDDS